MALALLAAVPRLFNLLALDPFIDEVGWLDWALRQFNPGDPSSWWLPTAAEGRPPLYFWLLLPTRELPGNAFIGGRVVAALCGVASTVALYALGRSVLGSRVGLVAGVLWALGPFDVFFSRMASSDDALLALCAILAALGGALMVRRPGLGSGAFCGVGVGLAIMSKTLGLLTVPTPLLALLTLAGPGALPRLLRPALAGVIAALVILAPLVPWLPQITGKAAQHTDLGPSGIAPQGAASQLWAGGLFHGDLFRVNVQWTLQVLPPYIGWVTLGLAGLGIALGALRRERAVLYLALVWAIPFLLTLNYTTTFFTRYLLFSSFPLYVLAASAIVWLAGAAVGGIARLPGGGGGRPAVGSALLGVGVVLGLGPVLPLTLGILTAPRQAPLPRLDHFQYVEQWYAVDGLGRVAQLLRDEARSGPVTVLVPRPTYTSREIMLLPNEALRLYLRGEQSVRFSESGGPWDTESICDIHTWTRSDSPTFFVINGTQGRTRPAEIRDRTREIEAALARELPEARVVLHIPRLSNTNWLDVYRLDKSAPDGARGGTGRSDGGECAG